MIIQEAVTKVPLRYDYSLGDRVTIGSKYLSDKKDLSPDLQKEVRKLLRQWKSSGGTLPIFEPKRRIAHDNVQMMMYVIEVRKRHPPTHIVVLVTQTDPEYKGKKAPVGSLYIFDRIFTDYDEYLHYINNVLKSKRT